MDMEHEGQSTKLPLRLSDRFRFDGLWQRTKTRRKPEKIQTTSSNKNLQPADTSPKT